MNGKQRKVHSGNKSNNCREARSTCKQDLLVSLR